MSWQEAATQYAKALKQGQKHHNACVIRGKNPYPAVLDDVVGESPVARRVPIGVVEIPMEQITGTTTTGRKSAFAGNFMPLLDPGSEFAIKWISLCQSHLYEGIHDPIICYEYMGQFYVTEGNKRVSVLKSYDCPSIRGSVTRVVPPLTDDPQVVAYYEFMNFFQLSNLYDVWLRQPGQYAKLQAALGLAPDHVWTKDEQISFLYSFRRFKASFVRLNTDALDVTPAEALMIWLQLNTFSQLEDMDVIELDKSLAAIWSDVRLQAQGLPIQISTDAPEKDKLSLPRLLGIGKINHLKVAFVHSYPPEKSVWTAAHEVGREQLAAAMGERITIQVYQCTNETAFDVMSTAVQDGAQVIFATTPPMIGACRQIAARHPQVRVLNCSLSMPYTGIRTYYSRMHEGKFITGAIAGAMADANSIGYVANYPIIGTIAGINAFALGARLTNPRAKVKLKWSCVSGAPVEELLNEGVTVISNRDGGSEQPHWAWEWGTYQVQEDERLLPLATPQWNWGQFYEKVIESIFNGSWDALDTQSAQAVNYWWGMSSGVIDVQLYDKLPDGVKQLAAILKQGIISGAIDPFRCRIVDQNGVVRNDGTQEFTHEDLMNMDWLCDLVEGDIPTFDQLLPASHALVRHLGVERDKLQPETEEERAL
ncbi:MAG: BMP family ABC transporter substrate-binding protein [Clostridiales bacterium]|nr:BMP family ABC transporter substrate-binding protein [Clostridiales bacterium]